MLNLYLDGAGDMQYVPVGNIADLRKLDVKAIGGVPVEVLAPAPVRPLRVLRRRHGHGIRCHLRWGSGAAVAPQEHHRES